jgi:predicted TIM-barrel fold metal-dependent hydrolase
MEHISRATQGWVHSFVPFCPFKQVAFWRGLTKDDPMALVQNAVLERGHIGVKMYPPMGFRPLDNASLPANYWIGTPVRQPLPNPALGADLDAALGALYTWCLANDVPVMAHTSPSNNPDKKYKPDVTAPEHWAKVLKAYPGLRVNFGHFGQTDFVFDKGQNASKLMQHMTAGESSPGGRLYADSAFFAEILSDQSAMKSQLRERLKESQNRGDAALSQRLMYGTDWEMVTIEGGATTGYLSLFEKVFAELQADPDLKPNSDLANRFFGANAANYLGLKKGQSTRARLEAFHGKVRPAWMNKVDGVG